jgi:cbb3-type cytochrome c oxidase subunit III
MLGIRVGRTNRVAVQRFATFMPLSAAVIVFVSSLGLQKPVIAAGAAASGEQVYTANCSACHGAGGAGTPGVFPPLAGNAMVTGSPDKVIAAVKNGLTGATTINGKTYNGAMPAWKGKLSNAEIASVITYIRSSWGNKASAVTEAQVAVQK